MTNYSDGGEAVVQGFRSLGIDYVMASPGSEWGGVWEAFARQKVSNSPGPTYLSCAHETLAVDLAIGYTVMTGRVQAVMLHTGVGLLQGAMGIDAAYRTGIPMVVLSGEALTYGEKAGFNPGGQWQANLSVVGGPHRLAEPIAKWSIQASSTETLYYQVVSAGELAQRTPPGPTYVCVPIETQLNEWNPPDEFRIAPPPSRPTAPPADIEKVAGMLVKAANPAIVAENAGRDVAGFEALVALAESLAIPVVEGNQSTYANFPKTHPLHQGFGQPDFLDEADLVLTVGCRAPWYPPSNRPKKATIVAIDETPFRPHLVHHAAQADMFLEGDSTGTLQLLVEAVRAAGADAAQVEERQVKWAAAHQALEDSCRSAEAEVAGQSPIHPRTLCAALSENLPDDTFYIDETITLRRTLLRHLRNSAPQSFFRLSGGLGQGIGVGLGVKLAAPDRPVAVVLGDGTFMYNPVVQSLALSKHQGLPILIVISNNNGYLAMKQEHHAFYPEGDSAKHDIYYGHPVTDFDYESLAGVFDFYGRKVENPAELPGALKEAQAAVQDGRTAILNVAVSS